MNVTLKRGTIATKTYTLSGKTAADVAKALQKRGHAGEFEWNIGVNWKTKGEEIVEVAFTTGGTLTMPKWPNAAKAGCKAEWERFYAALAKHEDGHRLIMLESVAKLTKEIEALEEKAKAANKPLTPKILQAWLKSNWKRLVDDPQTTYDSKTKHGATQKAVFDASVCAAA